MYLSLGIYTASTPIFIPKDKVKELIKDVLEVQGQSKVALKQLHSLTGSLAFVTRALPTCKTITYRIYGLMPGVL